MSALWPSLVTNERDSAQVSTGSDSDLVSTYAGVYLEIYKLAMRQNCHALAFTLLTSSKR